MATSTTRLELTYGLSGQSFIFNAGNITNFANIYATIMNGGECEARLEYSGDIYLGTASIVGSEILITFEQPIVAPPGSCIDIECRDVEEETDCKDVELEVNDNLRIAVLDDKGCLKGWIRLGDIFQKITHPDTLCKLYGVSEIPQGHLTASDRILTVDGSCMVKSIPATDIVCD